MAELTKPIAYEERENPELEQDLAQEDENYQSEINKQIEEQETFEEEENIQEPQIEEDETQSGWLQFDDNEEDRANLVVIYQFTLELSDKSVEDSGNVTMTINDDKIYVSFET